MSKRERIAAVLLLAVLLAFDAAIGYDALAARGADVAIKAAGPVREGSEYAYSLVVSKSASTPPTTAEIEFCTAYGRRFKRQAALEGSATRLAVRTEVPLESVVVTSPVADAVPGNDRVRFDVWSNDVWIADTTVLTERDVEVVDGRVWTVYTSRAGSEPPGIFLKVNSASTGADVADVRITGGSRPACRPGILRLASGGVIVYWEREEQGRRYIEYVEVTKDLRPGRLTVIRSDGYDLMMPVEVESRDGGSYIAALQKTKDAFGFRVYEVDVSGARLAAETGDLIETETAAVGFRDFTPHITGLAAGRDSEGFIVGWLQRECMYGSVNFLKMTPGGPLLVPSRELAKLLNWSPYWKDFEMEFLPEAIHVFWTEMNNSLERNLQVSRLLVDYRGDAMGPKYLVARPAPGFRGALDTALDARDVVHAVWVDQDPGSTRLNRDVFYQRFDAHGEPLEAAQVIVGKVNTQKYPKLYVLPAGERVLSWMELSPEGGYSLLFRSTRPDLVAHLREADKGAAAVRKLIGYTLNGLTSLASAVLFLIPLNLLPVLLFSLFVLAAAFRRLTDPLYYFMFLSLVFPAKYYNGLVFKSIFTVLMSISERAILLTNAATLGLLAALVLVGCSRFGQSGSIMDRFPYLFVAWLYLDTFVILAQSLHAVFS